MIEKSFERIEEILEKMNSGTVPLEEALKLFEEAEGLIRASAEQLNLAEKRVEMLVKARGEVQVDGDGKPLMAPKGSTPFENQGVIR
jgi:exodeoxyribonuclease VII small subunit